MISNVPTWEVKGFFFSWNLNIKMIRDIPPMGLGFRGIAGISRGHGCQVSRVLGLGVY